MIKYLELQTSKYPNFFQGKSIIDLGAGTCISSLACALLGARLVVATDGNDHCVELAASIVDTACSELEDIVGRTASGGDGDGGRAEGVEARQDGGDVITPSRTSAVRVRDSSDGVKFEYANIRGAKTTCQYFKKRSKIPTTLSFAPTVSSQSYIPLLRWLRR